MADATRLKRERRKLNKCVEVFFKNNVEECAAESDCEMEESEVNNESSVNSEPGYPANSDPDCSESYINLPPDSFDEYSIEDELAVSSSSSDDEFHQNNLLLNLREWCSTSGCSREKLNNLLGILRVQGGHNELPRDIRTLLHTPRDIVTITKCGGKYLYIGIENGINETISKAFLKSLNVLELTANIDGLPLEKSSNCQL